MATKQASPAQLLKAGMLPMPQGDNEASKWLIAAVLAAGKDGCNCDSCQLLKKFGGELSTALLKGVSDDGH